MTPFQTTKPLTQPPFGARLMSRNEALLNGITCRYSQPEVAFVQAKPLAPELTDPYRTEARIEPEQAA